MWKSRHEEQGNIVNFQQIENEVELSRGPFDMTSGLTFKFGRKQSKSSVGRVKQEDS